MCKSIKLSDCQPSHFKCVGVFKLFKSEDDVREIANQMGAGVNVKKLMASNLIVKSLSRQKRMFPVCLKI